MTEETVFNFVLDKHLLTLTTIGGIFTFAFVSSLKNDIFDPLLHFIFPDEFMSFMNLTIREGDWPVMPPAPITIKMGNFFKSLISWIIAMCVLYLLHRYTKFPDIPLGNIHGAVLV